MILGTTLVIALLKSCIKISFYSMNITHFFGFVWTSFIAFFGGKPSGTPVDGKRSYKAIVLVSLVGGLVIWIAFRASLTSELAIVATKLPFNDMLSLSQTNWRYINLQKKNVIKLFQSK